MGTTSSIEQEALASPSVVMDRIEHDVLFGRKERWNQGEVLAIIDAMRQPVYASVRQHQQQATDDALLDIWMGQGQPAAVHPQMDRTAEINQLRGTCRLMAWGYIALWMGAVIAGTLYVAFRQG